MLTNQYKDKIMKNKEKDKLIEWAHENYNRLLNWNPETKGYYLDFSDCNTENWSDSLKGIMMEIHGSHQQAKHMPSRLKRISK